jgi:hypothetical protein
MGQLIRSAKGFGHDAEDALMASVFDYAIQRASNARTGDIDLAALRTALTQPLRPGQPSLLAMLKENKLGDPEVYRQVEAFFKRVDEITDAIDAGDVAARAFDDPNATFDFVLRVTGAALGTATSRILHGGSGGSIIAAGAGSRTMRNVFERLPQGRTRQFLARALRDPQILAAMMDSPRTEKDVLRLTSQLHGYILQTILPGGDQVEQNVTGPTGPLPRGGAFGTRKATK